MTKQTLVLSENPSCGLLIENLSIYKADPAGLVKAVREALNLTQADAGQLLFGYSSKHAYDQWTMWENGVKKPSKPTIKFFELILLLALSKKQKIKGADKSLDIFIELQKQLLN
jgi:hypothetical protein